MKPNLVQSLAPIDIDYKIVYAKHASAWQVEVKFLGEVSSTEISYCSEITSFILSLPTQ